MPRVMAWRIDLIRFLSKLSRCSFFPASNWSKRLTLISSTYKTPYRVFKIPFTTESFQTKFLSSHTSPKEMDEPIVLVDERSSQSSPTSPQDIESDIKSDEDDSREVVPVPESEKYAYFSRGFTSEMFKLEIINLPPHVGFRQLKKRLKNLKLNPVKIKLLLPLCFVTFRSEEEREKALEVINGHVWKKKTLKAVLAKPAVDPLAKRKRKAGSPDMTESKRYFEVLNPSDVSERLVKAITPLVNLPYNEQLKLKTKSIDDFLRKVAITVKRSKPGLWYDKHLSSCDGLFCEMDPIRPSPVLEGYRNKCEFTIGLGTEGDTVIGFRLGAYRDGDLTVAPPTSCIVPEETKRIVEVFQKHVSRSSLKPFNCHTFEGHWKQLTVRCFSTGETMAIVQFNPQQLSQEEVLKEKQSIVEVFSKPGSGCVLTSLYWQTHKNRATSEEKTCTYEHLLGNKFIHEELMGVRFRVSPDAFFQVNSKAAEALYSTINELTTTVSGKEPVVYDLCCGTGTIGITLAKNTLASKIVGIEMSQQAVQDANHNAIANGVGKAEFVCGRVEDVLPGLMGNMPKEESSDSSVIAIADPPRGGLHPKVIQAIRKCHSIQRLLYVSCNPDRATNNFVDLCRPKSNRLKGLPFIPVRAVPVDMFPHTHHCELIVVFERVSANMVAETEEVKIEK